MITNISFLSKLFICGCIGLFYACGNLSDEKYHIVIEQQSSIERPREVWAFRSVLDSKIRMLSIGLNENLWVAYNTEAGSFYKAWNGGVKLAGSVYGRGGGQPVSQGYTYLEEPVTNPWVVTNDGLKITPEINYKGHTILNNKISLEYELVYKGNKIKIEEQPEFYDLPEGQIGLKRIYQTSDVPQGIQIGLKVNIGSIVSEDDYKTNGRLIISNEEVEKISGKQYKKIVGTLLLEKNGKTNFSIAFTPKPVTEVGEEEVEEESSEDEIAQKMMESYGCITCHGQDQEAVGPSYLSIAQRYKGTQEDIDTLVAKVINGGSGNWGEVAMIPHAEMPEADVRRLVSYILNLDQKKETKPAEFIPETDHSFSYQSSTGPVDFNNKQAGIAINVYQLNYPLYGFPQIKDDMIPQASGVANMLHADESNFRISFEGFENNFAVQAKGFLTIKEDSKIDFRLASNDGSRIFINNENLIETVGNWIDVEAEGTVQLEAGKHPFIYEYYDRGGDKKFSLQWRRNADEEFSVVPPEVFTFKDADVKTPKPLSSVNRGIEIEPVAGDGEALDALHPSFDVAQSRPESFHPKVASMDFMSNGRLVISTWDSLGAVYILEGVQGDNSESIQVKRIAAGLSEPLGLKIVDDEIYVLQKQELTKLIDLNGDEIIDKYKTISNDWTSSGNHHEFAFGLLYEDGYFYGTLSVAIKGPGPSAPNQASDRGRVIKIDRKSGKTTFVADGLRTPNGIGFGVDDEIFITDNQGDWLPANKILHLQEGAFYGNMAVVDSEEERADLTETPPVVYLEHDQLANSPSQPARLNIGPYQNQMIYGDVTHGGIKRVFAEKVNKTYQGAVFRFTQGLEAGINRMVWGPEGALYIGGIGNGGNWGQYGKLRYGLQKLTYNGEKTFEMLAVRAKPSGVEIEFTESLQKGVGSDPTAYTVKQWWYKPTANYGGPNMDEEELEIGSIEISPDRKKVVLELPGMKDEHVIYIRLNRETIINSSGEYLWTTEAWYTMNNIPEEG